MPVPRALLLACVLLATGIAGCFAAENDLLDLAQSESEEAVEPYLPRGPDLSLGLIHTSTLVPIPDFGIEIHVRLVRPDVEEPVPVIVEYTPYNMPGQPMLLEPAVPASGRFVEEFVRRGFAFAFADVRGTADSSGCLDLRGSLDIQDSRHLAEYLGTQEWSNGKVGFIGASYPGSMSHIGAIAGNPHVGGVVPVVASTSFYHYHHKGGVPYSNHLTTNNAYTAFAVGPTTNPQYENWLTKQADLADCDTTHLTNQLDQKGTYDTWWVDRNLRWRVGEVEVPVLMAQGLQDWNVKPDHIAHYWNDLAVPKTLIAGQWGHQFPRDAEDAYGPWWEFATAFFDETLRGIRTGWFDEDRAYVQDNEGTWHRYAGSWPPREATWMPVNLTANGLSLTEPPAGEVSWNARMASGEVRTLSAPGEEVVLALPKLAERLHTSGTPHLNLTIVSGAENIHLVARLEMNTGSGWTRMNYGYLNPTYREGLETPRRLVPHEATPVTIEMYPQEDVFPNGAELRLVLRSVDEGRTVPVFDDTTIRVILDGERPAQLWLPLSPLTHG